MKDFHDVGILVAVMDAGRYWLSCVMEGAFPEHAGRCMPVLIRAYCGLCSTAQVAPCDVAKLVAAKILALVWWGIASANGLIMPSKAFQRMSWTDHASKALQRMSWTQRMLTECRGVEAVHAALHACFTVR